LDSEFNARDLVGGYANGAWKFTPHGDVLGIQASKTHRLQGWINNTHYKWARVIYFGDGRSPTWPFGAHHVDGTWCLEYLCGRLGLISCRRKEGKGSEKSVLTRSLVDSAVASRKPRPKVVAAPPVATILLIEVPRHLEGMSGRPRLPHRKASVSCSSRHYLAPPDSPKTAARLRNRCGRWGLIFDRGSPKYRILAPHGYRTWNLRHIRPHA
jgi:hypothetical protein